MRNWLLGVAALVILGACGVPGEALPLDSDPKVFVCKYAGTPGTDERLQTGDNPISVSINALKNFVTIGAFFNDEQGRSVAIAFDEGQPEPSPDDCPGGPPPPTTTTSTTTTSSTTTTTTCPDCGINTVVIIPTSTTSTTLPPGVPNTFAVPGGTTTTTTGVTTTTLPGVGTTTTTTAAPPGTAVRVTTTTAPPVTVPPTGTLPHTL